MERKIRIMSITIHGMTKKNAYKIAKEIKNNLDKIMARNNATVFIAQPNLFQPFILDTYSSFGETSEKVSSGMLLNQICISQQTIKNNTTLKKLAEYIYLSAKEKQLTYEDFIQIYNTPFIFKIEGIGRNICNEFYKTFGGKIEKNNTVIFTTTVSHLSNSDIGYKWLNTWYPQIKINVISGTNGVYYFASENNLPRYCRTWLLSIKDLHSK